MTAKTLTSLPSTCECQVASKAQGTACPACLASLLLLAVGTVSILDRQTGADSVKQEFRRTFIILGMDRTILANLTGGVNVKWNATTVLDFLF